MCAATGRRASRSRPSASPHAAPSRPAAASAPAARRSGSSRPPCRTAPTGRLCDHHRQRRRSGGASSNLHRLFLPRLWRAGKLSYLALSLSFPEGDDGPAPLRLPSLNGVKAFEAAARTGSFAAAGAELAVYAGRGQPAGASAGGAARRRAVRAPRQPPGATTAAGGLSERAHAVARRAGASLTAQVPRPAASRVLTVGVGPTFAIRWLIPRLADFRKTEPDIEVRITTGGAAAPFGDDWTCGIKLGDGDWPGLDRRAVVRRRPAAGLRAAARARLERPATDGADAAARRPFA